MPINKKLLTVTSLLVSAMVIGLSQAPLRADMAEAMQSAARGTLGLSISSNTSAAHSWSDHKLLQSALDNVAMSAPGERDVFVLVAALDSDPVFTREAHATSSVLASRYGAGARSLFLHTGKDDSGGQDAPRASIPNLATAMAGMSEKMQPDEDIFILYTTSHGAQEGGIVYREGEEAIGFIGPDLMASWFDELGIKNRMLLISACFSGQFIGPLKNADSVIVTASSATRSSFGCDPGNDWTFFGDALVNNAFRTQLSLTDAVKSAFSMIDVWENDFNAVHSKPQIYVGSAAKSGWLAAIEANLPLSGDPVGAPAYKKFKNPKHAAQ